MIRALATIFVTAALGIVSGTTTLFISVVSRAHRPFSWCLLVWARAILLVSGARLTIDGAEHAPHGKACFFAGNHQSALDIPVLIAARRGCVRFMAKKSLFRIPVFGWAMWRSGHVPIDRSSARAAHKSLERMLVCLRRDPISFVVFPEGTRSIDGQLLPFRKGAMKICQRAELGIVPFTINGSLAVVKRGEFRVRPGPIGLRFAEPISAVEAGAMSPDELRDRVREAVERGLRGGRWIDSASDAP